MKSILIDSDLESYIQTISGLDDFHSALAIFDCDGNLFYQNKAFDSINKKLRDNQHQLYTHKQLTDCENISAWIHACADSTQYQQYTTTFFYSKNISVDLTLQSTPLINRDDKIQGQMISIAEEAIDYNKHHLAKLQDSNRCFKNRIIKLDQDKNKNDRLIKILLKNSPFALVIFNDNQQIIQTNSKAEQLFNLSAGQMTGKHCSKIINCYQASNNCKALSHQGEIETDEINSASESDKSIRLLRSTEKLIDANESLIIEAFIDTTSIRKAEDEIKRLGELNTLLINSTGEGIISVDNNLRCNFINKSGARTLGYKAEEIDGKNIQFIFHDDHNNEDSFKTTHHIDILRDSIETNSTIEAEAFFRKENGQPIAVQYSCSPLHKDNRVHGAVIAYRNVTEAHAAAKKLDYLATHDTLTGLLNRYAFEVRLNHIIEERNITAATHILCFIDLDQFKIVNDSAGHIAGDELLRQIGDLLHNYIRQGDVLARIGGDEYGLILCNCGLNKANAILNDILNDIIDYRFSWQDKIFTIGASIGLVELNNSLNDISSAINAADTACYIAKKNGRHRIHIYSHDDDDIEKHKIDHDWVNRIKDSLINNKFQLWQQPIVPINKGNSKKHFEILIRILGSDNEIISPGSFIPTAERYNIMADIDKWVIVETVKYLSSRSLDDIDIISINVSGQSITDDIFISFIKSTFDSQPDLIKHICFEVTETAAISNLSKASEFMKSIKKMGFSFALDDFGSGMSSFAYLKHLPVDYLKIDGNFIRDIQTDEIDRAMVEAIHSIAKIIGIKTIAEFVENNDIIEILENIGIDYVQGYALGKPEPLI